MCSATVTRVPDRGIEYPLDVRRAENEDAIIAGIIDACNLHFNYFFNM